MRVAVDVGPLYGHRTGVGTATDGMCRALGDRDDIELLPYLVSGRSTPTAGHRRLPVPGIVASHVWSRSEHPRADRWMAGAAVLHGTNYVAPPTRLPTVISVYDCWFLQHPDLAAPIVRRAGANLRRAVARGAWIHASSAATAASVADLLATDRVTTVALGAPAPFPVSASSALTDALRGRRFIVAIGTEERRKGLPLLIAAFAELAADHPDLQLALAGGPGDDSPAVAAAIDDLADATRVHRLGPVGEESKVWLLRNAAVLAYPSIDEGFGFPILEAQMAGTPVVAASAGSIPEVAGDAAILVNGRDAASFATALSDVLEGSGRLGLIEAGYRNVKRFDWNATAAGLVDLYQLAIDSAS